MKIIYDIKEVIEIITSPVKYMDSDVNIPLTPIEHHSLRMILAVILFVVGVWLFGWLVSSTVIAILISVGVPIKKIIMNDRSPGQSVKKYILDAFSDTNQFWIVWVIEYKDTIYIGAPILLLLAIIYFYTIKKRWVYP